jgi:hypothetical protein
MANAGQASAGSRGPVRAAVLSLVTVLLCGFWWWGHVNRQLRVLGRPADPGRALAAVTVGWLGVVLPFRSVHRTTAMIAEAERGAGLISALNPLAAVAIAAVARAGAVAWVATSLAGLSAGFLSGCSGC